MSGARDRVKILVVEDDQWVRFLVADLLREHGFEVLEASNGHTALRLAEQTHPDLVILDLALPETPGIEVLHELRRSEPIITPRVVITSARPDLLPLDDRHHVDAVFSKPYDILRLHGVVAELASNAVAERSLGARPGATAS
jgi:DNA-binding response OmpR family regulator